MRTKILILSRLLFLTLVLTCKLILPAFEFRIPPISSFVQEDTIEVVLCNQINNRFREIIGQEHAKEVLTRAVESLQSNSSPSSNQLKSILIKGRSGSGKTSLALALAGEARASVVRVRVAEELLFGQRDAEMAFGMKTQLELALAKARSLSQASGRGVVLLIDNLQTVLGDYILSQVIKDMSPSNSYSCTRSRLRNNLIKAIERVEESDDNIVIVACAGELEHWDKPYPREFEPSIDPRIEEKFREIIVTSNLSESEIEELVERETKAQGAFLEVGFDKTELSKKMHGLTPKMIINLMCQAVKKAQGDNRTGLKFSDFDLSDLEKKLADFCSKTVFRGRDLLGSGTRIYSRGQVAESFDNVLVPPELAVDFNLLVEFIKNPDKFEKAGASLPAAAVFFGDPGTGKTSLARAIAGQAGANLIEINCSNFMGRMSEVFALASKMGKPTVVLLDEIDALNEKNMFGILSHPLKRLIEELDGLKPGSWSGITTLATAKSLNLGSQDLFKLGRFEKILEIGTPCQKSLVTLLQVFIAKKSLTLDVQTSAEKIARGAMGMSRSQLLDMVNRAAIRAACAEKTELGVEDFEAARAAVMKDGELIKSVKGDDAVGSSLRGDDKFFQSPGKFYPPSSVQTCFEDVAGCDQAKDQLQEIVSYLKDPEKFKKCGAKIPAGVLMIGEPGTGKTLLARAVAGEAGCPFISVSASKFDDMYVGVGKNRIEALFKQARRYSPCLIFIDEIDAVGRRRDTDRSRGNDQTINHLLSEMDGFERWDKAVVVIAATNRADTLDSAIKRSGRFDRKVLVELPNVQAREQVLKVHSKKIALGSSVDLAVLAKVTVGMSGADLATLINEAALKANREERRWVEQSDLEWARDFVSMGAENRFLMKSKKVLEETAYHEAGHALIRLLEPAANPLHKITIVPRHSALGLTWSMPDEEEAKSSKTHYLAEIRTAMGGRAAEEVIFGETFSGVRSDLEQATHLATRMVKNFGMSSLGPVFFGQDFGDQESEKTKEVVDKEVRNILSQAYQDAVDLLKQHKDSLVALAQALLEKETLSGDEARAIANL
jgi:cell division protease FtsH